jgi:hypothetical protein
MSPGSRAAQFLSHLYRLILVRNRLLNAARFSYQPQISLEALEPRLLLSTTLSGQQEFNESIDGDGQSLLLDGAGAIDVTLRLDGPDLVTFLNPTNSLTIRSDGVLSGADAIHISGLDPAFSADLKVLGNAGDFVRLMSPGIYTHGGDLEISAGGIGSDTGVTISTRQISGGDHLNGVSTGNSGAITLQASDILQGSDITISSGTRLLAHVEDGSGFGAGDITLEADHSGYREATVLLPVSVALREAGISITDATLTGADIAIRSTAADLTLSDDLGAYSDQFAKSFFSLLNQLPGMAISALTGISVQVNYRHSDAAVSLLGTSVTSSGSVDIGATARADASLSIVALSGLLREFSFAFGYGEAKATAETLIDGSSIVAEGGVNVASEVASEAYLKARTSGLEDSPGGNGEIAVHVAGGAGEFAALVGEEFLVLGAQAARRRLPPVLRLDGVVAEEVSPRLVQEPRHQNPPRLMLAACGRSPFSRATLRFQYRYLASTSAYRTDWPSTDTVSRPALV